MCCTISKCRVFNCKVGAAKGTVAMLSRALHKHSSEMNVEFYALRI